MAPAPTPCMIRAAMKAGMLGAGTMAMVPMTKQR